MVTGLLFISPTFVSFSINPITGHIEEPMPNPIEDMTEEQKEYEAQKLANMIGELSRWELKRNSHQHCSKCCFLF